MRFETGKYYYTRNGKVAEITSTANGTVEGYVLGNVGDVLTLWHTDGRRSIARKSPIDLTEAQAPKPAPEGAKLVVRSMDRDVASLAAPVKRDGLVALQRTPAPKPVRGYVAEFTSRYPDRRYFSPVFERREGVGGLNNHITRQQDEYGQKLIRVVAVAEVPEELSA